VMTPLVLRILFVMLLQDSRPSPDNF
jgi:hypothetical protein